VRRCVEILAQLDLYQNYTFFSASENPSFALNATVAAAFRVIICGAQASMIK
jgi:hypothetical protein